MNRRIVVIVTIFVLLSCLDGLAQATPPEWPLVREMEETFEVPQPSAAVIRTYVQSHDGQPLYLFVCRAGLDEYFDTLGINYAGDLDCRLMPAELGEVEVNLLVEMPGRAAWYSRGRMFANELYGPCGDYPEWGRLRHFRLRGMLITLRFFDPQFVSVQGAAAIGRQPPVKLQSYKLRFTVEPDPRATGARAEPSGYLNPHKSVPENPRNCEVVLTGNEWQ